jgi:hypothetical protein
MRVHRTIAILEAHDKWIKEKKIKLSRFIQKKINEEMAKEFLTKSIANQ